MPCREVWESNFEEEIANCLAALADAGEGCIAFDVGLPCRMRDERPCPTNSSNYRAVRDAVNILHVIQFGLAVASATGMPLGAWNFNMRFDLDKDLHTAESTDVLAAAGVDFPRHAREGIRSSSFGQQLAQSHACGPQSSMKWVTFSGSHKWACLLKMVSSENLPDDGGSYLLALEQMCPHRRELQDWLPDSCRHKFVNQEGIIRCGEARTAASDALATLVLYTCAVQESIGTVGLAPACTKSTSSNGDTHGRHSDTKMKATYVPRSHSSSSCQQSHGNMSSSFPEMQVAPKKKVGATWQAAAMEAMWEAEMAAMLSDTISWHCQEDLSIVRM